MDREAQLELYIHELEVALRKERAKVVQLSAENFEQQCTIRALKVATAKSRDQ